jgi:hypothetical protein
MAEYELVSPSDAGTWQVYHAIRREVLFEARGLFGVYDENRPDERAPGNHSKLLLVRGAPVGSHSHRYRGERRHLSARGDSA